MCLTHLLPIFKVLFAFQKFVLDEFIFKTTVKMGISYCNNRPVWAHPVRGSKWEGFMLWMSKDPPGMSCLGTAACVPLWEAFNVLTSTLKINSTLSTLFF